MNQIENTQEEAKFNYPTKPIKARIYNNSPQISS